MSPCLCRCGWPVRSVRFVPFKYVRGVRFQRAASGSGRRVFVTISLRLACAFCLFQAGSRFQGGSRSASGRTSTFFVTMSLRLGCAFCSLQVGSRFAVLRDNFVVFGLWFLVLSSRCAVRGLRDDVVAFGLCVLFVSTRCAARGLCRVLLRVFVAMLLRMGRVFFIVSGRRVVVVG